MGIVYRVHDAARGEDVAMKRILTAGADGLLRFKREFRVMEELVHPSLVRLHELGADEDGPFFTMELLSGTTLQRYCDDAVRDEAVHDDPATQTQRLRASPLAVTASLSGSVDMGRSPPSRARPASPATVARLSAVLPQLLEALAFLHAHDVVHRDLKPNNVMVTAEGRLKVLDFGVLSELGTRELADGQELRGTVGYIAPEVLLGEAAGPGADLYALGVVLFEILAGRPVFEGSPFSVAHAHASEEPPRLSDFVDAAPPPLVEACMALLAKTPSTRPSLEELCRMLSLRADAPRAVPPVARPEIEVPLGRATEKGALLAALDRADAGSFAWAAIVGASGSGKTTLAQWLAQQAEARGGTVLRGRGRSTERVPFNAIDGAVDELSVALRGDPELESDGAFIDDVACAASAFPVLAACCPEAPPISTGRARPLVFDACVRVLARVGARPPGSRNPRGPLVLFVDDLQWADDDSRALLEHLRDVAPPHVLVVTTVRDDVDAPVAASGLLDGGGVERLTLRELDEEALSNIVRRVALEEGTALAQEIVRHAVSACAGMPFLAEMTARALARDPDAATGARGLTNAMLAPVLEARRPLLALLVAADGAVDVESLARIEETGVGATEDAVKELARARIVRRAGAGTRAGVVLYHDVVRTAALQAVGEASLVRAHGLLADWMASRTDARPEQRVQHLLSAHRDREASALARTAAVQAEKQRAHALAAEMYEIASRDDASDRVDLLRRRANALENAALYRAAAKCWSLIAAASEGDGAIDAKLREAAALVGCHDMQAGTATLREALVAGGFPSIERTRTRDAVTSLRFLLGPLPSLRSAAKTPDPRAIQRCERDLRVALLVVYLDPLAGTRMLQRVRAEAARAAAREVAAWCDWTFAYYALFLNGRGGPVPLADRYVASARRQLPDAALSDRVRALAGFVAGMREERDAHWALAKAHYDGALAVAERVGFGTTEHALVMMNRAQVDLFSQRLGDLHSRIGSMRAVSRGSPQTTLATYADILETFALLYQGRVAEARAMQDRVTGRLEAGGRNRLGYATRLVGYAIDVREDVAGAHLRWRRDLEEGRRFGALRYMRLGAVLAIGAIVEANALRRGEPGASYALAMKLARESLRAPPLLVGAAYRAMAYAEDARGDRDRAVVLLERAEREAAAHAQPVDVALAKYQRGKRLGSPGGARLMATARLEARNSGASESVLEEDAGGR
jgi:hypothetical protein